MSDLKKFCYKDCTMASKYSTLYPNSYVEIIPQVAIHLGTDVVKLVGYNGTQDLNVVSFDPKLAPKPFGLDAGKVPPGAICWSPGGRPTGMNIACLDDIEIIKVVPGPAMNYVVVPHLLSDLVYDQHGGFFLDLNVNKKPDPVKVEIPKYPHTCPRCKAPAAIMFSSIDCSRGCK